MKHDITMIQDGHLAFCLTCKGGEGSLTTECCGRPITLLESYRIYELNNLDFISGKWKEDNSLQAKADLFDEMVRTLELLMDFEKMEIKEKQNKRELIYKALAKIGKLKGQADAFIFREGINKTP